MDVSRGARPAPGRRLAAVAAAALAGLNLAAALPPAPGQGYLRLLLGFLGVAGLLAAVRLGLAGCFESRLVTAATAMGSLVVALLALSVGLPGAPFEWSAGPLLEAVMAGGCLAVVVVEWHRPLRLPVRSAG